MQVANGEAAAAKVQKYITKDAQIGDMAVTVITAAAESGSADAVRLVTDRLTGDATVLMSGDCITDISLASVLFKHRLQNAGITTVLSKTKTSAAENTKIGKTPKVCDARCQQRTRTLHAVPPFREKQTERMAL